MSIENSIKRGCLYGFIPHRLEINDQPELSVFPFNILFANFKTEDGKTIMGSALYEPDLKSLKKEENKWSMYYPNAYGGKSWILIEYNPIKNSYYGEKTVNDKFAGGATGIEWNMFFMHLTFLGLTNGEKCMLEEVK